MVWQPILYEYADTMDEIVQVAREKRKGFCRFDAAGYPFHARQ